ncbi:hypothetical protein V8B97DRAFT_2001709 [Scleroderma yunnanense]
MSERDPTASQPHQDDTQPATAEPAQVATLQTPPSSRSELLSRARTFLGAPEIRSQDSDAKRAFLAEKGLTSSEIDLLLREVPPPVPPRTYPAPLPSALPNLLIGIARLFTWLTGSSAIVLFIYYRYLLPRISQSYHARLTLRHHHLSLLERLKNSAHELKAEQVASYKELPRLAEYREDEPFAHFETLDDIIAHVQRSASSSPPRTPASAESGMNGDDVPDLTILRCGIAELTRTKGQDGGGDASGDANGVTTEKLFAVLERKLPWLSEGHGQSAEHQAQLWKLLTTCPLFTSSPPSRPSSSDLSLSENATPSSHPSRLLWKYTPAPPPPSPPLLTSLAKLRLALPRTSNPQSKANTSVVLPITEPQLAPPLTPRQRTLRVLSDFTGYITTQTYSLGFVSSTSLSSTIRGGTSASGGSAQEDEVRREIRALKGLVLNRKSFLPPVTGAANAVGETIGRPSSEPLVRVS